MSYAQLRATLQEPALIAVAAHWDAARGRRRMPAWRDIDPAAIKHQLSMVWAWRWDARLGTFIGRLAGEEITAVLGISNRGRRFDECFPAAAREAVFARFKRVIDEPALMHAEGKVYAVAGGQGWGERIMLPLADDGLHADGIIGATAYRLGRRPRIGEFAIDHLDEVINSFSLV